jgi:glutaminyl-tRNA synthetase
MGKRYLRPLVENKKIDGWGDPRMVTLMGMRRKGYPASAIRAFLGHTGISKSAGVYDFGLLEHYVREHLKPIAKTVMAVLDPIKLTLVNYPSDEVEWLSMENHPDDAAMGRREVPFTRELYIERSDFAEDPPPKYHRLYIGAEVRLKGAYFVRCTEVIKDAAGVVTELRGEYDPQTKSGLPTQGRKVKGTIHWVSAAYGVPITARLYGPLVYDAPDTEDGIIDNPDSLIIMDGAVAEPGLKNAAAEDRYQFMRNGYFCLDTQDSTEHKKIFNRTVTLKSSYKE